LMQGLADGYFIVPLTVGDYLATAKPPKIDTSHAAFRDAEAEVIRRQEALLAVNGNRSVADFHRELGRLMWEYCGMARTADGLKLLLNRIPELREQFWRDVRVPGSGATLNQSLENAGRVADFLEFGELMALDALERDESAGGHFRVEHQTEEGEAKRNDERFSHVAVWEYREGAPPIRHEEPLTFEYVALAQRSYK
ncbi:MAG: fumarate reductase/succinate dehydrogenase flavoprotein subunit, partial [Candidatus Cloacimonetes bacterium]|nr:fumarate reductase/succinate dehydrogenase flavoprotein subunit [Candidatus Cloacimonadota bacterium]